MPGTAALLGQACLGHVHLDHRQDPGLALGLVEQAVIEGMMILRIDFHVEELDQRLDVALCEKALVDQEIDRARCNLAQREGLAGIADVPVLLVPRRELRQAGVDLGRRVFDLRLGSEKGLRSVFRHLRSSRIRALRSSVA